MKYKSYKTGRKCDLNTQCKFKCWQCLNVTENKLQHVTWFRLTTNLAIKKKYLLT